MNEHAIDQERNVVGQFQPIYANRVELVVEICERLEKGEALAAICRDPDMPTARAVAYWADSDPEAASAIARARALGEDAIALECQEIMDGLRPVPGVPVDATRDKGRAWIRLQLLAKFNPKRWGDSTQLRHADADGGKLDTSPLVNELLTLLPGQSAAQPGLRNVTPGSQAQLAAPGYSELELRLRMPAYRPKVRRPPSDVDDLV